MNGFLSESTLRESKAPPSLVARCGACGLHKLCASPKMPVNGEGRRKILIVGEAPGKEEDDKGIPFVGPTGHLLRDTLAKFGVDLRRDCWLTNAARCRPPDNKLPDKTVEHCRPYLIQAANELKPEVIIPLGAHAVKSLIGWIWKEDPGGVGRWVGWKIPCQRLNAWICPTWHPAALIHGDNKKQGEKKEPENAVRKILFADHLKAASKLKGRPWKEVPDYKGQVSTFYDPEKAVLYLKAWSVGTSPVAFDFETDRLKPDRLDSRIVCCSVSDGRTTIAFPWHGEAIIAMRELLRSQVPKIGFNMKFEDRWVRRLFGHGVRNWVWDGQLASHVLDNRIGVKDLKFQSFVLLGQEKYNDHIEPFLEGKGSNEPNRIKEIGLEQLLLYCGLDSLLEFKVAKKQAKQLGVQLY